MAKALTLKLLINGRETSEMFRHFCFHNQNESTASPGLFVTVPY